jgi:hypothetical protein
MFTHTYLQYIRQTYIQTDRQTGPKTRKTSRQTNSAEQEVRQTNRQVYKDKCLHIHDYNTYSKTDILYIQTDRTERQERQTE